MSVEFLGPIANIHYEGADADARMVRDRSQNIELGAIVSCPNAHPPFTALLSLLPECDPYVENHEEGSQSATLIITTEFAASGFTLRAARQATRKRHPSGLSKLFVTQSE